MLRRLSLPLLLACSSFAVCLLALEGVLRLIGFDPLADLAAGREAILLESTDPILGYELTPNTRGFAWHTHVEINEHGTRDQPHPVERTGAYRILVLGDSVTFGSGVREEERFTDILELGLSGRISRPVEVLNFGVGGYDTLQEVVFLERKGLRFSPDLVMVAYCMNDLGNNSPNLDYVRSLEHLDSPIYQLRTVQLVRTLLDRLQLARRLALVNRDEFFRSRNRGLIAPIEHDRRLAALQAQLRHEIEREEDPDFRLPWYLSESHLGRLEFALSRLETLADDHGFEVIVSIVPVFLESAAFEVAYDIVEHLAGTHGFGVIRLDPLWDDGRDPRSLRLRKRDNIHPNVEGHRLIAEALLEQLAPRLTKTVASPAH